MGDLGESGDTGTYGTAMVSLPPPTRVWAWRVSQVHVEMVLTLSWSLHHIMVLPESGFVLPT